MLNGLSLFSAFSPLNDDPVFRTLGAPSPQQFGHNELTYARAADVHYETPQPLIFAMAINSIGFMPMVDRDSYAFGKTPDGPWTGYVPSYADDYAFPDLSGGMIKVRG